jgi:small GTP-binding protein
VKPFRVVVAGRPNVGKSALANRLARRRRSLVHNLPGVTRDVLEVEARLPDGRAYTLFDTGGYDPEGGEDIPRSVREKAVAAIESADMVLLVIDASAGVLPGDRAAARAIREAGRDAVVVANKIDRKEGREGEPEAWALGFSEVYGASAEHGEGVDDVQAAIAARMGPAPALAEGEAASEENPLPEEEPEEPRHIALAVVGRPSVGKTSLVAALLGRDDRFTHRRHDARLRRRRSRPPREGDSPRGHGGDPPEGADGAGAGSALRRAGAQAHRGVRRRGAGSRRRRGSDGSGRHCRLVRERRGQGPRARGQQVGHRGSGGRGCGAKI